jgi:hypothetical protein
MEQDAVNSTDITTTVQEQDPGVEKIRLTLTDRKQETNIFKQMTLEFIPL